MRALPILLGLLLAGARPSGIAATPEPPIQIEPDHADWLYAVGEVPRFTLKVRGATAPTEVIYRVGPEQFDGPEQKLTVPVEGVAITAPTMKTPGFLRLRAKPAGSEKDETLVTVGFSPERIQPTQAEPPDFDAFWAQGKAALARIPIDARLVPLPTQSTDRVAAYAWSAATFDPTGAPSRVHGILSVPKGRPGSFPAILNLPGAGTGKTPLNRWAAGEGFLSLDLNIHDIPLDLPDDEYRKRAEPLKNYWARSLENRDTYYYRRVILACLRANDYLVSRPDFDGKNLLVSGGSQGGMLTIMTAALDPRVRAISVLYPAFSDVTGYTQGRAGGWPGLFQGPAAANADAQRRRAVEVANSAYYDTVNFARRLRVPGFYMWGYNDLTCPPTSVYAAYNVITAPKETLIDQKQGHTGSGRQYRRQGEWLKSQLTTP